MSTEESEIGSLRTVVAGAEQSVPADVHVILQQISLKCLSVFLFNDAHDVMCEFEEACNWSLLSTS